MLWRTLLHLVRKKHGQKAWVPQASSTGAAPPTGITTQEALQIVYRPMPPDQTVEYEEDFGANLMIHREFVSKRHRDQMSFDISPLVYSDVELRQGQRQLAEIMNRERNAVPIGMAGTSNDKVAFSVETDPQTQQLHAARYLFNENRMRYCDRFQQFFHSGPLQRLGARSSGSEGQILFSLMEACAIVYGCDTQEAREAYYEMFCGIDLESLARDEQELQRRQQDAAEVERELVEMDLPHSTARRSPARQESISSLPSLFEELNASGDTAEIRTASSVDSSRLDKPTVECHDRSSCANSQATERYITAPYQVKLPSDYAPLYKAYLAHIRGESPIASYDISTLGAGEALARRRRWRNLVEKLVREDYLALSSAELKDAVLLDEQLHTIKFMDLKVGDTVREIMALLERETGDGGSAHRDTPLEQLPSSPERRV